MKQENSVNLEPLETAIDNIKLSSTNTSTNYTSANTSADDAQDNNIKNCIPEKVSSACIETINQASVSLDSQLSKVSSISSSSVIVFPTSQDDVEHETFEEKPKSIILGLLSQLKPGTDLSRVTLPTFVLEPRSLLERVTDFMAHQQLLLHAHLEENPIRRFIHVIRYYLSGWHIRPKGIKKPYNPVLGEHFKCHWDVPSELFQYDSFSKTSCLESQNNESDCKSTKDISDTSSTLSSSNYSIHDIDPHIPCRHQSFCKTCNTCPVTRSYYVSEQVSHHPPISAYFFSNPAHHTTIIGNFRPKSKFLGNSGASIMHGTSHIYFTNREGEEYIVTNPNIYIRGIFLGTMLMELGDSVTIECPKLGLIADIDFKVKGYFTGTYNAISGKIKTSDDEVLYNITGKWTDKMIITPSTRRMTTKNQNSMYSAPLLDRKRCKPDKKIPVYDHDNLSCNIVSNDPVELLDVSKLHSITLNVAQEQEQHPLESRILWSNVTAAIKKRDMKTATIEKTLIEDRQRAIVKLRETRSIPDPNPFNLTMNDVKPFESKYFTTIDGIRWDFKKNFDRVPLTKVLKSLDDMISMHDYRMPDLLVDTPNIIIQSENGLSECETR